MKDIPEEWELHYMNRLKIERAAEKDCTCRTIRYELDLKNGWVRCQDCGVIVEPFQALLKISRNREQMNEELKRYRIQAEELKNYKPFYRVMKEIEQQHRKKAGSPRCPYCEEPFMLDQLKNWVNWKYAVERIEELKREKGAEKDG